MILKLALLVLTLGTTFIADANRDYRHMKCSVRPCNRPSGKRPHPRILAGPSNAMSVSTSSTNWSGYVSAVNLNKPVPFSVSKVSGSWVVPSLKASSQDTWCSIWVGIDGAGSPSVEQIGTEHDVSGGKSSHYAWYEMYPAGSNQIVGFPVDVGDSISASVMYVPLSNVLPASSDLFIMQITNHTKQLYSIIPTITQMNMQRVCAEWVIEAPYMNSILPLSNFDTIYMSDCACTINNIAGSINNPAWNYESMTMVDPKGVLKAIPSILSVDGKSFSVAWKHN